MIDAEHGERGAEPAGAEAGRGRGGRARGAFMPTIRPSRTWTWRLGRGGHLGVVGDQDDRAAGRVQLVEEAP